MSLNRIIHLSKMTGTAGSEGHLLALLKGLRAKSFDARLWILVEPDNPVDDYVARAAALDIPIERIPIRQHFDPALWRKLVRRFRRESPDLVHTHLIHADLYGITAARTARVPHVMTSRHNDDKFRYRLPLRVLNRVLWRQVDAGIAISEAIRRFSIEIEHAPPNRVHTIHYGLDPSAITAPPDARQALRAELGLSTDILLVGSICRLIEQKGLSYGLRGFAQVANRFPEAHYVIAGDGPLRKQLELEARRLHVADRVHFLGWRNDPRPIFAALDVLLAPSLWEGFGLVFLEAMALGIPIISTAVSAIPEIVIDGETGWLTPPRSTDAISAALQEALSDGGKREARGQQGRARLETHFSVDRMVEQTVAIYRRLEANA